MCVEGIAVPLGRSLVQPLGTFWDWHSPTFRGALDPMAGNCQVWKESCYFYSNFAAPSIIGFGVSLIVRSLF
jgi:hypothetical protein